MNWWDDEPPQDRLYVSEPVGSSLEEGRLLTCTRCRETVRVFELPGPFIDPDLYVCGECESPDPAAEQLTLVDRHALGLREEYRDYDPTIARMSL